MSFLRTKFCTIVRGLQTYIDWSFDTGRIDILPLRGALIMPLAKELGAADGASGRTMIQVRLTIRPSKWALREMSLMSASTMSFCAALWLNQVEDMLIGWLY